MSGDDFGLDGDRDDGWISAADLMGGMLLVFFLLMVYFMLSAREEIQQLSTTAQEADHALQVRDRAIETLKEELKGAQLESSSVREVAVLYDQKREELYHELVEQFQADLPRWNAEILEDLTIRFNEPSVLFDVGSANIRQRFKVILNDFFPRYVRTITKSRYREDIAEIRIEGHTSSFWNRRNPAPVHQAYLKNMDLSFQRCRSVLHYVTALTAVQDELVWLRRHLTANGLSSSQLILDEDGNEDWARSQRVEFRVRTDAESKMARILELAN